eukprot:scaffold4937_cov261-Pinguiococcus_pyrenoidosus.AAC.5
MVMQLWRCKIRGFRGAKCADSVAFGRSRRRRLCPRSCVCHGRRGICGASGHEGDLNGVERSGIVSVG